MDMKSGAGLCPVKHLFLILLIMTEPVEDF